MYVLRMVLAEIIYQYIKGLDTLSGIEESALARYYFDLETCKID